MEIEQGLSQISIIFPTMLGMELDSKSSPYCLMIEWKKVAGAMAQRHQQFQKHKDPRKSNFLLLSTQVPPKWELIEVRKGTGGTFHHAREVTGRRSLWGSMAPDSEVALVSEDGGKACWVPAIENMNPGGHGW
jgi:hypothetical protein